MSNNFNFYHELEIENVLQCPVCFELPNSVIFLCKVGHHMCDKCRKRLTVCPTCQSALTGCRNFLAESLMTKLAMFKGSGDGPNNNVPDSTNTRNPALPKPLEDNNNNVPQIRTDSGRYFCQLEACSTKVELGPSDLTRHIEAKHPLFFEKFKNTTGTFVHDFKNFCFMKKKNKYTQAFQVTNFGLFFLNIIFKPESYLHIWISTAARVYSANKFKYSLEFTTENNVKLSFISKVASTLRPSVDLLERGDIFIIPQSTHSLEPGHFFSIAVKIVYKQPSKPSSRV